MIPGPIPVLGGFARLTQRIEEPGGGLDAIGLMTDAVIAALADSGARELASRVGLVAVPRGMWPCTDPGRVVADAIGATSARTVAAEVGVLQHSVITGVCERIAAGELEAAIVCGGEARYRHVLASRTGVDAPEHPGPGTPPDEVWRPANPVVTAFEFERGIVMAPIQYSMIESALAHANGLTPDDHRAHLGELWSSSAAVAADDPLAWDRSAPDASEIAAASEGNRMVSHPYTRLLCSQWNVDQAAALVFTSESVARELGMSPDACVYPVSAAESNAMIPMHQRRDIHRWPAFEHAARAVLELAHLRATDIDLLDIYSCFPSAVQVQIDVLGLRERRPLTVTGGMTFAGGPLNNYVLQATVAMAERLRTDEATTGLVTGVSGLLTKPGLTVWSSTPPDDGFRSADVTEDALRDTPVHPMATEERGAATVIAATVSYARGQQPRALAVVELDDGSRTVAGSDEDDDVAMFTTTDVVGQRVTLRGPGSFGG